MRNLIKYSRIKSKIKEIEMNRILDKILFRKRLTNSEIEYIERYNKKTLEEDQDYMMVSKNFVYSKVSSLLEGGKKVICDLHDRNGKIGLEIKSIENYIEHDECIVIMTGDEKHKLHDKFLYNLIYSVSKDRYSLQEHDEYFEKIEVNNNED